MPNQKNHGETGSDFVQNRLRVLGTLTEMNREIHATMNMDRLLQVLVEKAVIGVNFERGLIYLLDGEFLKCVAFLDRVKRERGSTIEDWVGFTMDETAVEVLAVKERKPMYVRDAQTDLRINDKFLRVSDTKEYCVVPLMGRNRVLGVLTGDKFYSEQQISPDDIETLELFAGHISLALENATLYEEKARFAQMLEKRVAERTSELSGANARLSGKMKELSALFEMSKWLSESLKLEAISNHILSMVRGLGHEICAIHLMDQDRAEQIFALGLDPEYTRLGAGRLAKIWRKRLSQVSQPLLNPEWNLKATTSVMGAYLTKKGVASTLLVPLSSKEKLLAVLAIYTPRPELFQEDQLGFFSAFAKQASIALEKAFIFQNVLDQRDQMHSLSQKLAQENISLREKIKADSSQKIIIGTSPSMNQLMDLARKVAPTSASVMIYGETGTGKELIANAIHEMSPRKNAPLIKINCAAIPEDLLESELFGHEKGAFTGAHERRIGMFELAQKGTIFLDEIGDIPLKTQIKLLRVLQEQEIQPLGSKAPTRVDVRVIAATHQDLNKKIADQSFRSDLFFRLNVFPITLPPLRNRKEDMPELIDFFLNKYAHLRPKKGILDQHVVDIFLDYHWPGNIRELENIIERLMIISKSDKMMKEDLPTELLNKPHRPEFPEITLKEGIAAYKRKMVEQALSHAGGKKAKAAELLGLPRSNFSRLMKQLGMR